MEFVVGIILGALLCAVGLYGREHWQRQRQADALISDIEGLELPVLLIHFPSGRIHVSEPMRGSMDIDTPEDATVDRIIGTLIRENDRIPVQRAVEELRSGVHVYRELSFAMRHRDGRWHEMQAQAFRIGAFGLRSGLVAVTLKDRTQSREVVEERDRLFNLSLDLMAVGDLTGRLLQVNPAWVRVLRWSRDDIMDRTFIDLIHPDDQDRARLAQDDLREGIPVRDLELRTMARDGSHRWISWSSFPLIARRTVFTVARDITDRKHAEQELQRYQDRLKQLASQLSTVEERERRRLAEILHDTLAQELFAAQAKLTLLKYPDQVADVAAVRDEAAEILDHATELARTLTFELFPPALYEVGLDAALEWLCRSFKATRKLPCDYTEEGQPFDLAVEHRALLYQGARELLANVFKHAGASRAEVTVRYLEAAVEVRVDDDGQGFDFANQTSDDTSERTGGFGLFNIRERLSQVGGQLNIETSHLGGGRVSLTLPAVENPS